MNNISFNRTDSPINSKDEDEFKRYPFANRISNLIKGYKKGDSITIGVYGGWGEGKTSVLNLIKRDLEVDKGIVSITFNPWLFSNESQLLVTFFQTLGGALKIPLKSKGQKFGKFLSEYSSLIGNISAATGLPNPGKIFDLIGKKLSERTLEQYRDAINKILLQSDLKIVVFLDDIDRLNNEEINQIFRLVKLTADFKNTLYVLAFDEDMVAESLSKVYSQGGYAFLEKIIQIPLKLPRAQKSALKRYVIDHVNRATDEFDLIIDQDEQYRFVRFFEEHFLPSLENPRFAVRYANSLNFSVPLLKGEVNTTDLFLIEGLKLVYPELYNFIRDNATLFTKIYDRNSRDYQKNEDEKKEAKQRIEDFLSSNDIVRQNSIKNLLQDLFPQLKTIFRGYYHYEGGSKDWYFLKRICSGRYFDRYFSYAVLEGEISDVYFDQLLERLSTERFANNTEELDLLLKDIDPEELTFKLNLIQKNIEVESSHFLLQNISLIGTLFPIDKRTFLIFPPISQIAFFMVEMILRNPMEKRLEMSSDIIKSARPLSFAFEIWKKLYSDERRSKKYLNEQDYRKLSNVLLDRCKTEYSLKELFDELDDSDLMFLMDIWSTSYPEEIRNINHELLTVDSSYFLKLLYIFSSKMRSSSHPEPYNANFDQTYYKKLEEVVNVEMMFSRSLELFGELDAPEDNSEREPLSDNELIGQFQKLYRLNNQDHN